MGIAIPRPTMRRKEARIVKARLRRHKELMDKHIAEGMTRSDASALAFKEVTAEIRYD